MTDLGEIQRKVDKIYQAVIGIPESPADNGLVGDIQEIKEQQGKIITEMKRINGEVAKNSTARRIGIWLLCFIVPGIISILGLMIKSLIGE